MHEFKENRENKEHSLSVDNCQKKGQHENFMTVIAKKVFQN